jgi:hypothetical protein
MIKTLKTMIDCHQMQMMYTSGERYCEWNNQGNDPAFNLLRKVAVTELQEAEAALVAAAFSPMFSPMPGSSSDVS